MLRNIGVLKKNIERQREINHQAMTKPEDLRPSLYKDSHSLKLEGKKAKDQT